MPKCFYIFFFMLSGLLTTSCYYDSEELLYPVSFCDTSSVSYAEDIVPIMEQHCNSCHGEKTYVQFGGNLALDTYAKLSETAKDGSLTGSVNHSQGFAPMPYTYMLDVCARNKITQWIEASMPE